MGLTYANLELKNPLTGATLTEQFLVDTGATHLCIPEHIAVQLGFDLTRAPLREITVADGSHHRVPYVGPLALAFANRSCFVGALVVGDEGLLGAIPMEDMDLVVTPASQTLTVNPKNPHLALATVKSVGAHRRHLVV